MNYRYTFGTHYQNEADANVVLFRSGRGETHASTRPRPDALLPTCQAASVAKTGIETRPRQNPSSANCSVVDGAPEGVSVTCDRTASLCMPKIFADTSAAAGVSSSGRKPVPRKMPMLRKGGIQVLVLSRLGGLRGQKGWLRRLAGGCSVPPHTLGSLALATEAWLGRHKALVHQQRAMVENIGRTSGSRTLPVLGKIVSLSAKLWA